MRVISGKYRGKRFSPPKNFPSRPTTDMAKEALFNILNNAIDFEETEVLDLFAGTGNVSLEFLSRGCPKVLSVDRHPVSAKFLIQMQEDLSEDGWTILRRDAFAYIKKATEKFDLIFCDPPFGLKGLEDLPDLIFEHELLNDNGLLIIEHGRETDLSKKLHFDETRTYGGVNFSFFKAD